MRIRRALLLLLQLLEASVPTTCSLDSRKRQEDIGDDDKLVPRTSALSPLLNEH